MSEKLIIDVKAQDSLREWFSKRGILNTSDLIISNISLGDSDINYELSAEGNEIKNLPTPFSIPQIQHKLVYEGEYGNLTGEISCFTRYIDKDGIVKSKYSYPSNSYFTNGVLPPVLENGEKVSDLNFTSDLKEGYILYFQTLPEGFKTSQNVQYRLKEDYSISIVNLPQPLIITNVSDSDPLKALFTTSIDHGLKDGDEVYLDMSGYFRYYTVEKNSANSVYLKNGTDYIKKSLSDFKGSFKTWEFLIDKENGSLLISKLKSSLQNQSNGKIIVKGKDSSITKEIMFNY